MAFGWGADRPTPQSLGPNPPSQQQLRTDQLMILHRLALQDADRLDMLQGEDEKFSDRDVQEACAKTLEVRLLPVTALGRGHTSTADKYAALVHVAKLESGDSLPRYMRSIVGCVTDQGWNRVRRTS